MELAVASVDEVFTSNEASQDIWVPFESLLRREASLHVSTIWYWASPALLNAAPESQFAISSHMAKLWQEVKQDLTARDATG